MHAETIAEDALWYDPAVLRFAQPSLCVFLLAALAFVCYRHPAADDFDRYIYEAIVRGKSQSLDEVYSIVKHESPRTERSSLLDSPQHLRELEPLYAIRPLYLAIIRVLSNIIPIQSSINLISAAAMFGSGIVVLLWTRNPLLSGLLMASYPILSLARYGTPDALAALMAISALWLVDRRQYFALSLLFVSLGVRTDNLLLLLGVLALLAWQRRMPRSVATALALLSVGVVLLINYRAQNYGWIVLFRLSFIGGGYPLQMPNVLTVREYVSASAKGVFTIADRVTLWVFLGVLAWKLRPNPLLLLVGCVAAAHFVLYPSGEDRYLVWAYIATAALLIRSFEPKIRLYDK